MGTDLSAGLAGPKIVRVAAAAGAEHSYLLDACAYRMRSLFCGYSGARHSTFSLTGGSMTSPLGNVLFVSPFKSTRGYAWDFIGRLYARVADHLTTHGISTFVAYPSIPAPPPALEGSTAQPILLDASLSTAVSLRATIGLIRRENIKVIHFISHPAWSWHYPRLRRRA